jgi:hypothetical protein
VLSILKDALKTDFLKVADEQLQFGDSSTLFPAVINRGTVKFRDVAVLCSQKNQSVAEIWVLTEDVNLQRGDVLRNETETFKLEERIEKIDEQIEHWVTILTKNLELGEKAK